MKTPSIATLTLHVCPVLLVVAITLAGCAAGTRPPQTQEQLLQLRDAMDQRLVTDGREMFQQLLARVKGRYDAYSAGRATAPPVIDILIISGGGDWGAFGAGFLKGWSRVAPQPGVFIKETMNNLADLGEKMGADPLSWRSEPPPP